MTLDELTRILRSGVRPIAGWPTYYATSDGQVLSVRRGPARILVPAPHRWRRGHLRVQLYDDNGARTMAYVHRLVCLAWHGPPSQGCEMVLHDPDPDVTNNRPGNLRWGNCWDNAGDRRWADYEIDDQCVVDDDYWLRHERAQALAGQLGVYIPDPRWGF